MCSKSMADRYLIGTRWADPIIPRPKTSPGIFIETYIRKKLGSTKYFKADVKEFASDGLRARGVQPQRTQYPISSYASIASSVPPRDYMSLGATMGVQQRGQRKKNAMDVLLLRSIALQVFVVVIGIAREEYFAHDCQAKYSAHTPLAPRCFTAGG
ncbi:hypothetical protein SCHPADRAFT_895765 [Schizopora paradoxa]|uniref:Uncharacterized protein n=1 Tax=Schizopora paradoxa TaxID=27342 RepID=A0A0H2R400_9AGAM|nr:hypothetical protein SCHPADRAFT_895765 [Schizopora paradoxa]